MAVYGGAALKAGCVVLIVAMSPADDGEGQLPVFPWGWLTQYRDALRLLVEAWNWKAIAIYSAIFLLCIVSLAVIGFLRSFGLRTLFVGSILFLFSLDLAFYSVAGSRLTPGFIGVLWTERGMAMESPALFLRVLSEQWIIVAMAVVLLWPPSRRTALPNAYALLPVLAFAGVSAALWATRGGTQSFPTPFILPFSVGAAAQGQQEPIGEVLRYEGEVTPSVKVIVLLVDESIRGDFLTINNPNVQTTPWLKDAGLINFGVAVSAANCSAASRTMLRFGERMQDFEASSPPERISIFQFAKRAGYTTILINAYANKSTYMGAGESSWIDRYIGLSHLKTYERDEAISFFLRKLIPSGEPLFVYVNKYGAHQPYEASFSDSRGVLRYDDRDELVQSYAKAVTHSVDRFFQTLLPGLDLRDVAILYTSDHGQSLMEDGQASSHCNASNPVKGEVLVPLLVATQNAIWRNRLAQSAEQSFGRATHFDIFPTLIDMMGYNLNWIEQRFGQPGLRAIDNSRSRKFLRVGDSAASWRIGAKWISVD